MVSNIKIIKINSEISSILINEPKTYNSLSLKNLTDLLKVLKKGTNIEEINHGWWKKEVALGGLI